MRSFLRKLLKGSIYTCLSILGILLLASVTAIFVGRSTFGKKVLLSFLVKQFQKNLSGRLEIKELETDLFSQAEFHDLTILDSEGQVAVLIKKIRLEYKLWPLLHRILYIKTFQLNGAEIHGDVLSDGHVNLVSLIHTGPSSKLPIQIQVDSFAIQSFATFIFPKSMDSFSSESLCATLQWEGQSLKIDDEVSLPTMHLLFDVQKPYAVRLEADGGLQTIRKNVVFDALSIHLQSEFSQWAEKLFPVLGIKGNINITSQAHGSLEKLMVNGGMTSQGGLLEWEGIVTATSQGLDWNLQANTKDFSPSFLSKKLPPGKFDFVLHADGHGMDSHIKIEQLNWSFSGGSSSVTGQFDIKEQALERVFAQGKFDADDLRQISEDEWFFQYLPKVYGNLSTHFSLEKIKEDWSIEGNVAGAKLVLGALKLGQVHLEGKVKNGLGQMSGQIERLAFHQFHLDKALIAAELPLKAPSHREISFQITGKGLKTQFELKLRATPLSQHGVLLGLNGRVSEFLIRRAGLSLELQKEAHLQIENFDPFNINFEHFSFTAGKQELKLAGSYQEKTDQFHLNADVEHLNLRNVVRLFTHRMLLPKTNLKLHAKLYGTLRNPQGEILFSGEADPFAKLKWQKTKYRLKATLKQGHIRGVAKIASSRTQLEGRFRFPLSRHGRIDAAFSGQVPWQLLRVFLPDYAKDVGGNINVHATLLGSFQKPLFELQLESPQFQTDLVQGRNAKLALSYDAASLQLSITSGIRARKGVMLGQLDLDLHTKFQISYLFDSQKAFLQHLSNAPFQADVHLQNVEIGEWFRSLLPTKLLLSEGFCIGSVHAEGSLSEPILKADLNITHVVFLNYRNLFSDLDIHAGYQQKQASVTLKANLQNQSLIDAQADVAFPLDVSPFDKEKEHKSLFWKQGLIQGKIQLLPYDLSLVSSEAVTMAGRIQGQINILGSMLEPKINAQFFGEQINVEEWRFPQVQVLADYANHQKIHISTTIQGHQGNLQAEADVPFPFKREGMMVYLFAHQFDPNYEPKQPPSYEPRVIKGIFDADVKFSWPAGTFQIQGFLRGKDGSLGFRFDPRLYQNIDLDLDWAPKAQTQEIEMRLNHLKATAEVGTISGSGSAILDGWKVLDSAFKIQTENFPFSQGSLGLWIDSQIEATAVTKEGVFTADITALHGTARLPQLNSSKDLQSLEKPGELIFVDQKAQKEERLAEEQAQQSEGVNPLDLPTRAKILIHLPGPFHLKGPEIGAEIEGQLVVDARQKGASTLTGYLRALSGWTQLFEKRYEIQKAQLTFDGDLPPNPVIELQLSRDLPDATLYVEAHGTFSEPQTLVRADPPIYDSAQALAILWGGDPKTQKTYQQPGQNQGALGLFSSIVSGQLRQQLRGLPSWAKFDTLQVESSETADPSDVAQTRFEIGKYLFDNLYVGYSYQFGVPITGPTKQNRNQLKIEYRFLQHFNLSTKTQFLRNLELNTVYGDAGVGAIDIFLHWRF